MIDYDGLMLERAIGSMQRTGSNIVAAWLRHKVQSLTGNLFEYEFSCTLGKTSTPELDQTIPSVRNIIADYGTCTNERYTLSELDAARYRIINPSFASYVTAIMTQMSEPLIEIRWYECLHCQPRVYLMSFGLPTIVLLLARHSASHQTLRTQVQSTLICL